MVQDRRCLWAGPSHGTFSPRRRKSSLERLGSYLEAPSGFSTGVGRAALLCRPWLGGLGPVTKTFSVARARRSAHPRASLLETWYMTFISPDHDNCF